jgi:hypothetical protein
VKGLALLLVLLPLSALADERILLFHGDIAVMQDGWIEVTETIRVRAEGDRIRRGIYRDLPTEYFDKLGNRYEVDLDPLALLRNDRAYLFRKQRPVHQGGRAHLYLSLPCVPDAGLFRKSR